MIEERYFFTFKTSFANKADYKHNFQRDKLISSHIFHSFDQISFQSKFLPYVLDEYLKKIFCLIFDIDPFVHYVQDIKVSQTISNKKGNAVNLLNYKI